MIQTLAVRALYAFSFVQLWSHKWLHAGLTWLDSTPLGPVLVRWYLYLGKVIAIETIAPMGQVLDRVTHAEFVDHQLGNVPYKPVSYLPNGNPIGLVIFSDYSLFRCVHFLDPYVCPKRIFLLDEPSWSIAPGSLAIIPPDQRFLLLQLAYGSSSGPVKIDLTDNRTYTYWVQGNRLTRPFMLFFMQSHLGRREASKFMACRLLEAHLLDHTMKPTRVPLTTEPDGIIYLDPSAKSIVEEKQKEKTI